MWAFWVNCQCWKENHWDIFFCQNKLEPWKGNWGLIYPMSPSLSAVFSFFSLCPHSEESPRQMERSKSFAALENWMCGEKLPRMPKEWAFAKYVLVHIYSPLFTHQPLHKSPYVCNGGMKVRRISLFSTLVSKFILSIGFFSSSPEWWAFLHCFSFFLRWRQPPWKSIFNLKL